MATNGFFTYHDLYGGKPEIYHYQSPSRLSSFTTIQLVSISNTITSSLPTTTTTTINLAKLVSSTTIQLSTTSNKFYKLIQFAPFAYFHWFLIGLAILLTLLLAIIFTCYCRSHCRKNKKILNEKKQPLPNFYRYRTGNRRVHVYNGIESIEPLSYPSPKRPCPPKSVERLNNKLLREGLDAVGSPQVPRTDITRTGSSSTFTGSASNLLTEMKSRLSIRSSEPALHIERPYETQRANMALNDESKSGSLLIDMN